MIVEIDLSDAKWLLLGSPFPIIKDIAFMLRVSYLFEKEYPTCNWNREHNPYNTKYI